MSDEPATGTPPTAAQRRAARQQERQRVPRHTALRMRTEPTILGHSAAVVGGAFAVAEVDDEAELTVAEATRIVEDFLERPVVNEHEAEAEPGETTDQPED